MKKYIIVLFLVILVIPLFSYASITSYTDYLGVTHYSDGSTSRVDYLGNTIYTGGSASSNGSSHKDYLGNTHYDFNDGTSMTKRLDYLGNTIYTDNKGININTRVDYLGKTIYSDNNGRFGSSYTDYSGITHYDGDIFTKQNCPKNSIYDSLSKKCKCGSGYSVSGSNCVYNYSNILNNNYQEDLPVSETTKIDSKEEILNTEKAQTIDKEIQKNISNKEVPTCTLTYTPKIITLGGTVTETLKTTGYITNIKTKGTGLLSLVSDLSYLGDDKLFAYFFNEINSGKNFDTKIQAEKIGKSSKTHIVTGPKGSSSCEGSFTVILEPSLKNMNDILPSEEIKEEVKVDEVINLSEEPLKEQRWYSKIINWIKRK